MKCHNIFAIQWCLVCWSILVFEGITFQQAVSAYYPAETVLAKCNEPDSPLSAFWHYFCQNIHYSAKIAIILQNDGYFDRNILFIVSLFFLQTHFL